MNENIRSSYWGQLACSKIHLNHAVIKFVDFYNSPKNFLLHPSNSHGKQSLEYFTSVNDFLNFGPLMATSDVIEQFDIPNLGVYLNWQTNLSNLTSNIA